jgi:hypothetical protein
VLEVRHHNLTAQLTSFVGRNREIEEITRAIARTRVLTLTGQVDAAKRGSRYRSQVSC